TRSRPGQCTLRPEAAFHLDAGGVCLALFAHRRSALLPARCCAATAAGPRAIGDGCFMADTSGVARAVLPACAASCAPAWWRFSRLAGGGRDGARRHG